MLAAYLWAQSVDVSKWHPGSRRVRYRMLPHYEALLLQSANISAAANAVPRDSENQLQLSVLAAFVWAQSLDVSNLEPGSRRVRYTVLPH